MNIKRSTLFRNATTYLHTGDSYFEPGMVMGPQAAVREAGNNSKVANEALVDINAAIRSHTPEESITLLTQLDDGVAQQALRFDMLNSIAEYYASIGQ